MSTPSIDLTVTPFGPDPTAARNADDLAAGWHRDNQRHLALLAAALAARLDARPSDAAEPELAADLLAVEVRTRTGRPVAAHAVAALFGLTRFELGVLVAAAARDIGLPCNTGAVTFGRALAGLPDPHWSALLPDAPLRGWRLLDLPDRLPAADIGGLADMPLSVDERVLHGLLGAATVDHRLAGHSEVGMPGCLLPARHLERASELAALFAPGVATEPIQLMGEDRLTRRQVAISAGERWGMGTLVVSADVLPDDPGRFAALVRLVAREAGLGHRLVVLEVAEMAGTVAQVAPVDFAGRSAQLGAPVVVSVPGETTAAAGWLPVVRIPPLTATERTALLDHALNRRGHGLPLASVGNIAAGALLTPAQLDLAADRAIRRLAATAGTVATSTAPVEHSGAALVDALGTVCRSMAVQPLHGLATVHRSSVRLADLVLPEVPMRSLNALVATVRQRARVHDDWGYGERRRGLAVTALFAGPSGTGKSTAAEAVARELGRDLVSVDLSQVVSKYLGETEKNLAVLFAAAESGSVLLFDEGDALFGRRTVVRDSRDRYANLEISYLLQRLETFDGIAILTTNARENVDPAFLRRMRFVVGFPFPDAAQRATLWRGAFPPGVPTHGLLPERLGQLAVSGGTIAQLALHAAFLAADDGGSVTMRHILDASRIECEKLERPLTAAETKGWS